VASLTVGVCAETAPGERRAALVPAVVGALSARGARVAVEAGAGRRAGFSDGAYARAGAEVVSRAEAVARADLLLGVGRPAGATGPGTHRGQVVAGLLRPLRNALTVRYWADHGITAISFDLLGGGPGMPAGAEAAGPFDAAAQQARITGHQAVLAGLLHSGRGLPGSVTGRAARPVRVLVAGGGPAGEQAARTARDTGAVTAEYGTAGAPVPAEALQGFDIAVLTAAELSPGVPRVLVGEDALAAMAPGSVVVDTTAEADGGSVAGVRLGETATFPPGVTVLGAGDLPSCVAYEASLGYAERVTALIGRFVVDGRLVVDLADPLHAALVVTHRGDILREDVQRDLHRLTEVAGLP
jgi:NAD(P) transhydrogenase subunit alpha